MVVTPAIRALIRDDKIHQIYSLDAVGQEVRHADAERRAVPAVHERARSRRRSASACRADPNEFLRMIGEKPLEEQEIGSAPTGKGPAASGGRR